MSRARAIWPILIPLVYAFSVFHAWFGSGLIIGDDQFRFSHDVLASSFPWRSAWDGSFAFGHSTADSSPAYPLWSIAGLLARAGADFALIERAIWLWPLFLCLAIAPFAFALRITRNAWAAAIAACVFAVNTWTIALVQRGQIPSLVAYALIPFAMLAFESLLERRRAATAVRFAALFTMQIIYDLRYAYITAIACAMMWLIGALRVSMDRSSREAGARRPGFAMAAVWTIAAAAAFNAYWILPQLVAPTHLPVGYDTLRYYLSASSYESLAHAAALFYPFYHYYQGGDPFAVAPVEAAFFALPILAALAAFAAWRNPWALPLAAIAIIGVATTSGPHSPFGPLNQFAFLHVPGMKLFRDSSKFTSLVAFGYAGLFALGFAWMISRIRDRIGAPARWTEPLAACAIVVAYIVLMRDAYDPQRASNFAATTLSADDIAMQAYLDKSPDYFRTLLFPTWRPHLVGSERHPVVSADYILDYAAADGGLGDLFPTAANLFDRLSSPVTPVLLAQAGVRYIVVDDDPLKQLYEPYQFDIEYAESVDFFRARPWLHEVATFGRYVVFAVSLPQAPRAFFASTVRQIAGAPASLVAVTGTPDWGLRAGLLLSDPSSPAYAARVARADGWTYTMDPVLGADGFAAPFNIGAPRHVRAWAGGQPRPQWAATMQRVRMTTPSDLQPDRVPAEPLLPKIPISVDIADPSILSAPYDDPRPGVHWIGMTESVAKIPLVNWTGSAVTADVLISGVFAPGAASRDLLASIGRDQRRFSVPAGGPNAAVETDLRGVRIEPGSNTLTLVVQGISSGQSSTAAQHGFQIVFADDVRVANATVDAETGVAALPHSLTGRSRVTPDGVAAIVATDGGSGEGRAAFALLHGLSVALTAHPTLDLTYQAPREPARAALFVELRRRSDGARAQFVHPLPSGRTKDVVDLLGEVHAALGSGAEATGYDVTAARLVIIAPRTPRAVQTATIADVQLGPLIDPHAVHGDPNGPAVFRPVDLRAARLANARARPSAIDLSARCFASERCAVDIPVADAGSAHQLVFWTRTDGVGQLSIQLTFASHAGSATVDAATRPSLTNALAPLPIDWQSDVVHAANGTAARWRRLLIDLDDVKAYHLSSGGRGYALAVIHLSADAGAASGTIAISDVALIGSGGARAPNSGSGQSVLSQALEIDGHAVSIRSWRVDALTGRATGATGPFSIGRASGIASVEPAIPHAVSSLYLAADPPASVAPSGSVEELSELSPAVYLARTTGSGLFVFPMSFAPGWRAFALAPDDPAPEGIAMIDAWRYRQREVPVADHYSVNGAFNGWQLSPGAGRIVLLYEPDAISELCALLWLALSVAVIAGSAAASRGRP
jgi:hypothetical protein